MLIMSPFFSTRPDGRGLPKISAGLSIGVEPMIRKSMSPPPSMMAAAAAALHLVFLHAGLGARDHRLHRVLAELAGLAHAVELLLGVDHDEVVQEVLGEHELGVRQLLAQRVVLVDRHVIAVARVDLHQPDAALLQLQVRGAARP